MSMLLVHELHEARDRILLLKQYLEQAKGHELPAYRKGIDDQIALLDEALNQAHIPDRYKVAVVGRFKVGKSAFVNKLLGQRLAGVDTNPETAAISVFRYDTDTWAEVELLSAEEWQRLKDDHEDDPKNPEVKRYDRYVHFNERPARKDKEGKEIPRDDFNLTSLVGQWVHPGGKIHRIEATGWDTKDGKKDFINKLKQFTSSRFPLHYLVNKLTVYAPVPILRDQIEIIDTPGLDDTEKFRVQLTDELVKDVDAILFLTVSGASYSQTDKDFIMRQLRLRQIKHLQLIITKSDETYANAARDANENEEDTPRYDDFKAREIARVRSESRSTLDELLESSELNDADGYYYIEQLQDVPVQLVSAKFHDDGELDRGGIEAVRSNLYKILSTSNRFEQARSILNDCLRSSLTRLNQTFRERLNTLETEFDPDKVRTEIESIRVVLRQQLDVLGNSSGEGLGLLAKDQEAALKLLPQTLELVGYQAKDVLHDIEKEDLVRHWKTRRHGRWGTLADLQAKVADKVFPRVEVTLNDFLEHLNSFMVEIEKRLSQLQSEMGRLEGEYRLAGLEPLDLASAQTPLFENLRRGFRNVGKQERDAIVSKLDDFVTEEVQHRLDQARTRVADVMGRGTTVRQGDEVSKFYSEIKRLLTTALRSHLDTRIHEYAAAIYAKAGTVVPRIREASESAIDRRVQAIRSSLEVATEGQKKQVAEYLNSMVEQLKHFAARPEATSKVLFSRDGVKSSGLEGSTGSYAYDCTCDPGTLQASHYEIPENATGYTYERIFRPYIDSASCVTVEDPYIRFPHQVDNFSRFCALAVRCGNVKQIDLITGKQQGEDTHDADSRLETLARDLGSRGIAFNWKRSMTLHDREVSFDNGWSVKIGRGLDIYHKPESRISVEAADFSLRRCRSTKVDAFRR